MFAIRPNIKLGTIVKVDRVPHFGALAEVIERKGYNSYGDGVYLVKLQQDDAYQVIQGMDLTPTK